jgi:hypothetical protein
MNGRKFWKWTKFYLKVLVMILSTKNQYWKREYKKLKEEFNKEYY